MSITAAELSVVFNAETSDLKRGAGEAQGILKNVAATAGGFLAAQAFTGIVGGLKELTAGMISANAQAETMRMNLDIAAGSMERGGRIFSDLQKLAANTPFEFPELMQSAIALESLGVNAMDYIELLGNTAAATGKSLDQVTQAFLDAQMGEFERLKEFGIRASVDGERVLFTYMTAHGQVTKEVEKGNQAMYQSTLEAIWSEKYAGAMDTLSQSFAGRWSTLKDNFNLLMQEMGKPLFAFVGEGIAALNGFFGIFNKLREKGVNTFQAMWGGIRRTLKDVLGKDNPLFVFIKNFKREVERIADAWREGGIPAVIGQVLEDGEKAFRKAWRRLSSWVMDDAVPGLVTELNTLRLRIAENAPGWIEGALAGLQRAWAGIVAWAKSDAVTDFVNGLGALKDKLLTKIEENIPTASELFTFGQTVGENIGSAVGTAIDAVNWTTVIRKIGEGMTASVKGLATIWGALAVTIAGLIAGTVQGLATVDWSQFATELKNGLMAAIAGFADFGKQIWDQIVAMLQAAVPGAGELAAAFAEIGKNIAAAISDAIWNALPDWAQAGIGRLGGMAGLGGGGDASAPPLERLAYRPQPSANAAPAGGTASYDQRTVNLTVTTQASDPRAVATEVMSRLYGAMDRVGAGVA